MQNCGVFSCLDADDSIEPQPHSSQHHHVTCLSCGLIEKEAPFLTVSGGAEGSEERILPTDKDLRRTTPVSPSSIQSTNYPTNFLLITSSVKAVKTLSNVQQTPTTTIIVFIQHQSLWFLYSEIRSHKRLTWDIKRLYVSYEIVTSVCPVGNIKEICPAQAYTCS